MAPPQGSGGGAGVIQVVYTDDAATKLSDRVRRRCFNCCTTDTSTWRRSNLSPGKLVSTYCVSFFCPSNARTRVHPREVPAQTRPACVLDSPLAHAPVSARFPFWEIVATLFRCHPFLLHPF
ncbi:hypothetical protein B0H13DRAFT_2027132, partial [Mycena leptocephala]